ncbi:MAG: hypothetical protein M2R45_03551 [Verrucomicrobia subdivision 3 bacterium]|nr:hypothetical protein [Limisphaerales bacterium]MCS1416472.1 hypothetical protein [Limisphaerales bacterium]
MKHTTLLRKESLHCLSAFSSFTTIGLFNYVVILHHLSLHCLSAFSSFTTSFALQSVWID